MSTTFVPLRNDLSLTIEEASRGYLTLKPAFGGASIELQIRVSVNVQPTEQFRLALTAQLKAGPLLPAKPGERADRRTLCELRSEQLVVTSATPMTTTLLGYLSNDALRAVEEIREGEDLSILLSSPRVRWVDGSHGLMDSAGNGMQLDLAAGDWMKELTKVTDTSYVEVLIPITDDEGVSLANGHIATAQRHIRENDPNAAAGELRQVVETIRVGRGTSALAAAARSKTSAKDRDQAERYSLFVEDMFAYLSVFQHDDNEAAKGATMGRAGAIEALGTVTGMLHRYADDRRRGLI